VAADEQLERPLVTVCDESFQQFGVPDRGTFVLARDATEVANDAFELTGWHAIPSEP
jgi:hypothetical protein